MTEDEIIRDYLRHGAGHIDWYPDRPAMTDPQGTAALAAALASHRGDERADGEDHETAAAILGEHGVFTADGRVFAAGIEKIVVAEREQRAEIAALRAALEETRRWVGAIGATNLDTGRRIRKADALAVIDRARAALAKEASGS